MKTKYVLLVLIALFTQTGYGQKNIGELFKDFSQEENVARVSLGNFSMKLAGLFTDVMGVNGVEVLSLDDCSQTVKENFRQAVKDVKDNGYETMLTSNEGDERTRILVKIEKETIRELIVFSTGSTNALIRIKGKIKPSDIDSLVKKHRNG